MRGHSTGGPRVAVIGDFMLDAYVRGSVTRVCPDAPAAVLDAEREVFSAGGAGNVAVGCSARGMEVIACGFTGSDAASRALETLLAESGVRIDGLVGVPRRTTLVKRRYLSGDQVLLRVDEGTTAPIDERWLGKLDVVLAGARALDAVMVSDYAYGSVTDAVIARLAQITGGSERRPVLLVDSKTPERFAALNPDAVKPNYRQMRALLGDEPRSDRVAHVLERGDALLDAVGARNAIVTLDADGAVVVGRAREPHHVPAPPAAVTATSGAGDTFLVAFASALLTGCDFDDGVHFATRAATAACRGGATVSAAVPADVLFGERTKRVPPGQVACWAERMRAEGRRVVLTNGCFDIFHAGHADYLQKASEAGDVLLVAVNTDESVRRLKGEERPVNQLEDRLRVLESIGVVSAVTWFDDETAARVVREVKPDAYVKGSDYRGLSFPEADYMRLHGGRVVFVDLLEGRSTTGIVERVRGRQEVAV